ncbi:MAG: SagB/ThcOx family dehydrogenase [Chitinivibrionales bacterium]|nr:SagB/ThcOx family dehydrogenase [Chitinivibrionales bacterium]
MHSHTRYSIPTYVFISLSCAAIAVFCAEHSTSSNAAGADTLPLASPRYDGAMSVAEAIYSRKSVRNFKQKSIPFQAMSQLLWAAGGKTVDGVSGATRSYPSAGGLYPLEIYLVCKEVDSIAAGVYRYEWNSHSLTGIKSGDLIDSLKQTTYSGSLKSTFVPACIVITADYSKTALKYGDRGADRYVPMDAGGSAQNVYLQARALGIATWPIGAFDDTGVKKVLGIDDSEQVPLCIIPCGKL